MIVFYLTQALSLCKHYDIYVCSKICFIILPKMPNFFKVMHNIQHLNAYNFDHKLVPLLLSVTFYWL
jgi:hypothetical protein